MVIHVLVVDADEHNGPQIHSAHTDYDQAASAMYAAHTKGLHIETVNLEHAA